MHQEKSARRSPLSSPVIEGFISTQASPPRSGMAMLPALCPIHTLSVNNGSRSVLMEHADGRTRVRARQHAKHPGLCTSQTRAYKRVWRIEFATDLPKTISGKIRRVQL